MRVDAHLSALRDIQSRIGVLDPGGGTCGKPARPMLQASPEVMINGSGMEVANPAADVDTPQRNHLPQSLLVSALPADRTRVGTIMMAPARRDIFLRELARN